MKKGRFLWSAHRITERQKDGKARSIKGKQLKNSRNTVSKLPVVRLSSPRDNRPDKPIQKCSKSPEPCGFPGFFLSKKSVVLCPILEGFDLAWPGFSWLIMGQQALFDPVMIKKWGNCEPKSGCFRGHFPRHFFDSMTAFVNGFSFEGDVLICQDLTKPNPVYLVLLSCRCYVLSGWTRTFAVQRSFYI